MPNASMSFADHLSELRKRLIVSAIAIVVGTAVSFLFADSALNVLLLPSGGLQLRAFKLLDGFMIKLRVALYSGIILSAPVWAYEAIRFISPGLRQRERSLLVPFLVSSLILFAAGTGFGYYLLWGMIKVLVRLFPPQIEYFPSADDYISFVTFFLLSCGIAFQLPCVLIALVRLGIVSTAILRKGRRIAYFALFALAEIITPVSDPIVAPLTVMLPLVVLYEAAILIARKLETSPKNAAPPKKLQGVQG
jgi:sec-independent protein translocase protein TatC